MAENFRLARLYLVLLAIFTVGRLSMSGAGVPYEHGHQVFSLVILTALSCLYYGAFCRRWRGFRVLRAMGLAAMFGLISQSVILLATVGSYGLGVNTYFTHPTALQADAPLPFAQALVARIQGLVGNTIMSGIVGALGWALGGLLPAEVSATQ
jgi:hypothetical protein